MGLLKVSNFIGSRRRCAGLTLVEGLVVGVIVLVFVLMLLPPITGSRQSPVRRASLEMSQIAWAIKSYESTYHRWPVTTNVEQSGMSDFTFGTFGAKSKTTVTNGGPIEANNSELISVIMDAVAFGDGRPTPNAGHALNPQRNAWLNAKTVSDTDSPGVGPDGVYRDPWGNPYIIRIDLKRDGKCRDSFSSIEAESPFGNTNPRASGAEVFRTTYPVSNVPQPRIMVWSFGPDGKADPNKIPDEGVNKDNVVSWR